MASSEKIIANESEILDYLPQKPPMVMVGKLLEAEGRKTVTSLKITKDNIFCSDGLFREPGLIENIAQTAAAGAGYSAVKNREKPKVGFIGGLRGLRIVKLPMPGDEIFTEVTVEHEVFDATVVNGKVFLNDLCIAECELKIFLMK
jgi:3-hydroxymyristoyl/3-hydroxydecanoyl-(acyl carrier protein) dehydratase